MGNFPSVYVVNDYQCVCATAVFTFVYGVAERIFRANIFTKTMRHLVRRTDRFNLFSDKESENAFQFVVDDSRTFFFYFIFGLNNRVITIFNENNILNFF